MIRCRACGHDNLAGHIFCAKCGGKLQIMPSDLEAWQEPPRRRPEGSAWRVIWLVLIAGAAAGIVLAFWPGRVDIGAVLPGPADAQQAQKKIALLEQGFSPAPQRLTERELNAYLAARVAAAPSRPPDGKRAYQLRAAALTLRPSAVTVAVDGLWGPITVGSWRAGPWRVTHAMTVVPEVAASGGLRWHVRGGRIGHLPLPGRAGRLAEPGFRALRAAAARECALFAAVTRLELEEGQAIVAATPPARPVR